MPKYTARISLTSDMVFLGKEIEGQVIFTASKNCQLNDAKLEVVCRAYYHHQGRKKHDHKQPNIAIPLMKSYGMRPVEKEEQLTEVNRPTVFTFRAQLPKDLFPSTSGRCMEVLDVSYTLKLSSKRGFFGPLGGRKEDAAVAFNVLAELNLQSGPYSEKASKEVVVQNMQFGQGMDLMVSAHVPRLGWESLQTVPITLDISRTSSTNENLYDLVVYLERTISYQEKTTITDLVQSKPTKVPSDAGPVVLKMIIHGDTPVTGVEENPILSVHYRLRVEIKSMVNRIPTFLLALPVVIGTQQRLLTASLSGDEGGSNTDLRGFAQAVDGGQEQQASEAYSLDELLITPQLD